MALTPPIIWTVRATFRDKDRNVSGFSFNLPAALDVTAANAAALVVVNAAAALSNAALTGYSMSYSTEDPAIALSSIAEASDVERKGVFTFNTTNGFKTKVEIPSLNNAYVLDGTNNILVTDLTVLTFIAAMNNTGLGANNSPVTARGEGITPGYSGTPHKIHRGSVEG